MNFKIKVIVEVKINFSWPLDLKINIETSVNLALNLDVETY